MEKENLGFVVQVCIMRNGFACDIILKSIFILITLTDVRGVCNGGCGQIQLIPIPIHLSLVTKMNLGLLFPEVGLT